MSVQRCAVSLAASTSVFRFASSLPPAVFHLPRDSRTYSRLYKASKRELQTATSYSSHSLDPIPAPPRNAGIPGSSIAGTVPEVNNTRPPRLNDAYSPSNAPGKEERQSVGVTEQEAQKTKPVVEDSTPSPNTSTTKAKRPKLRARKAAMTLTPAATAQLQSLLSQPEPKMIRVGVKNRGCSGLAYHLEFVDKAGTFDEAVEQDGVKVLIDSKALFSIIGSEMDWVEDKLSQRFVFRNPNISTFYSAHRQLGMMLIYLQRSSVVAESHSWFSAEFGKHNVQHSSIAHGVVMSKSST